MANSHSAFIFPAFASGYTDPPGGSLHGFTDSFSHLLKEAAATVDPELASFRFSGPDFLEDELKNQFMTYIFSCAASKTLRSGGYSPVISTGYSMGIYAALCDAGAISFRTGLELIRIAFGSLQESLQGRIFGMATVIGLSRSDILGIGEQHGLTIEITNCNASHSLVVSGRKEDISRFIHLAREEGALHVRDLGVTIPYHSSVLEKGANIFSERISELEFSDAAFPVISLIDQQMMVTAEQFRTEVVRNLHCPLDWLATQQAMVQKGIAHFIECGPTGGLKKNAKFIEGEFTFRALDDITEFPLPSSAF